MAFFFSGCLLPTPPPAGLPRFTESKKLPVKVDARKTPFTFGYLEVPENRERPTGKTIKLPVYIFKSRGENPAADPVLYTVGGPGTSSMGAAPYMRAFAYLEDRDLILFEQRGTKYARPHLSCPEVAALPDSAGEEAYLKAVSACRTRLVANNVDLDAYSTREIAADIEDLRKTLNIKQLNLLTISYSTKIAQTMMRDYPASIRSVVMDSPLPLDVNYGESTFTNAMGVYERIFTDCRNNPDCNARHPDLEEKFLRFLEKTGQEPLEIAPDITITAADIFTSIGDLSTRDAPGVPAMISAVLAGDENVLRQLFGASTARSGDGLGMRLSVWCGEETPFNDPKQVALEREKYAFLNGIDPMVYANETAKTWAVRRAPDSENQAVSSDIPTLIISGSYDAVTPLEWGERLQQSLSSSHHLVFPGWGHTPTTYWDNSCGMEAARAFFNEPERRPETACLKETRIPDFE